GGDADAHRAEFVAALGDVVPDENVAVQAVRVFPGLIVGVGDPVIVVGGAHLVRVAVFQRPADPNNKDGRIFLEHLGLALLARQVGIHVENFFGVQEGELFGKIGITGIVELGE